MEGRQERQVPKDMYNTGRRSAISTSELGLYSDHSDYYNTSYYSTTVRKIVIGIMVVVSFILIGIFLYDFASSASISSKVNQETKHIYILQNSLRKPTHATTTKQSIVTLAPTIYIVNTSQASNLFEDRSDDDHVAEYKDVAKASSSESRTQRMVADEPESKMLNLKNFKLRNSLLDRQHSEDDGRGMENHAMIYRVSRVKMPEPGEVDEDSGDEDDPQRAVPFRFELKGPPPASFKRPKYPQLTQYRYPHSSRNIQDIIKYLTSDPETLNRGIKFTGFYVNPKKYDTGHTDIGEVAMNSDRSEEQENAPYAIALNSDPLYQYKPKHPADVNLLAPTNFRFSPTGLHRYNPYFDSYYQRPNSNKQATYQENQYDSVGSYGTNTNYGKRRKPKPFSVMLDIYPITEGAEQTKKSTRFKTPASYDDADPRRPIVAYYPRHPKVHGGQMHTLPITMQSQQQQQAPEEEEKHQMILHLNVYPKRKSKLTRNDVIERSEMLPQDEKAQLINRMLIPLHAITEHLTDHIANDEAKFDENESLADASKVRYEETVLAKEEPEPVINAEEMLAEKLVGTTQANGCNDNCEILSTTPEDSTVTMATTLTTTSVASPSTTTAASTTAVQNITTKSENSTAFKDIDTVEGFQQFADSLIAMD